MTTYLQLLTTTQTKLDPQVIANGLVEKRLASRVLATKCTKGGARKIRKGVSEGCESEQRARKSFRGFRALSRPL